MVKESNMKKLILIAVLLSLAITQQGCYKGYRPNTRKGWHQDEINRHTERISRLNPVIYKQNQEMLPKKATQLGDTASWQQRMRSRMQGMKE